MSASTHAFTQRPSWASSAGHWLNALTGRETPSAGGAAPAPARPGREAAERRRGAPSLAQAGSEGAGRKRRPPRPRPMQPAERQWRGSPAAAGARSRLRRPAAGR